MFKEVIIDLQTNEVIEQEMPSEVIAEIKAAEAEAKAIEKTKIVEAEAKAQAKTDLLAKLGITEDEAKLLLS